MLVPVIPIVPFLLLAAGCYSRGFPRTERWLLENPLFGRYLKDHQEGKGLTARIKAASIAAMVGGISFSAVITGAKPLPMAVMMLVALAVIVHLLTLPTAERGPG